MANLPTLGESRTTAALLSALLVRTFTTTGSSKPDKGGKVNVIGVTVPGTRSSKPNEEAPYFSDTNPDKKFSSALIEFGNEVTCPSNPVFRSWP
jgi:hypothetical protein